MIWIVIPTRNESAIIRRNLERLLAFCHASLREEWRVVVAVNGSTDATADIVREIAAAEPRVELFELPEPGKGGAVLAAWRSAATRLPTTDYRLPHAFVFMDADLATDLRHLPELIAVIRNGADIAVGSRYAPGAHVQRSILRRIVSRGYRFLLRTLFDLRMSDAPCGFKAVSDRVVREIIPRIRDTQWFFDTEILIRAQRTGMRIVEIPVTWHEPRHGDALRKVLRITTSDLRALWRLHRELFKDL